MKLHLNGLEALKFASEDDKTFWVPLMNVDNKGQQKTNGYVRMQIDLLPMEQAKANPVGECQKEPNTDPFLPKPFGRIEFSFNPFKMLAQLVGPAWKKKMYCACCILCCVALLIVSLPQIVSSMVTGVL